MINVLTTIANYSQLTRTTNSTALRRRKSYARLKTDNVSNTAVTDGRKIPVMKKLSARVHSVHSKNSIGLYCMTLCTNQTPNELRDRKPLIRVPRSILAARGSVKRPFNESISPLKIDRCLSELGAMHSRLHRGAIVDDCARLESYTADAGVSTSKRTYRRRPSQPMTAAENCVLSQATGPTFLVTWMT